MTKPSQGFHDFCGGFVFNNHRNLGLDHLTLPINWDFAVFEMAITLQRQTTKRNL